MRLKSSDSEKDRLDLKLIDPASRDNPDLAEPLAHHLFEIEEAIGSGSEGARLVCRPIQFDCYFHFGVPPPAIMRLPNTSLLVWKILVRLRRSVQTANSSVSLAAKPM